MMEVTASEPQMLALHVWMSGKYSDNERQGCCLGRMMARGGLERPVKAWLTGESDECRDSRQLTGLGFSLDYSPTSGDELHGGLENDACRCPSARGGWR